MTKPPSPPVEMPAGITPSPIIVTPAPPQVTPASETVVPPSTTPAAGDNPAQAPFLIYRIQQKEQGVTVVAFDPARGEERDVVILPFEAGTDAYVYGSALPAPDQSRLAASVSSPGVQRVYLISNGEARLIISAEGEHAIGAWSPDGSRFLVFSTKESAQGCIQNTCYYDIYVIDAATGAETRLTATGDAEVDAVWSPDGKQIAFLRGCTDLSIDECGPDLYLMNADGSNERLLAEGWVTNPVFLGPDQLAYIRRTSDGAGVYRTRITGGTPQAIIDDPQMNVVGMRISPDRRMIAFLDVRGGCQIEECVRTIYLVATDSGDLRPIRPVDAQRYAWGWTPDGRLWLLLSNDDSQSRLVLYAADGTLIDERVIEWQP
ncbi:MAG: hypothetical protein RMJ55_06215 [Roseiflexaceae bacterium]|nr:hypothetical protein [Roseiflexaceae bacterium]